MLFVISVEATGVCHLATLLLRCPPSLPAALALALSLPNPFSGFLALPPIEPMIS